MNKKMILSLGTIVILSTSAFAFNNKCDMKQGYGCKSNNQMMMKGKGYKKRGGIERMVMHLDLSQEQQNKIRDIIKQSRTDIPKISAAFSDNDFDKEKFIKLLKDRRDGKIERRAQMISKVYAVLNPSQKKELKTMIDMKEIMKKRNSYKDNCGFRRM